MWLITALASALIFGLAGWWMKVSQMQGGSTRMLLLALYASGALGFCIHSIIEGSFAFVLDIRIWVAGVIIGIGSAWGNSLFMKALQYGPASLTSPLTNMNIVLVVMMSIWWYKEPISLIQTIGISLLLIAVILIAYRQKEPLTIAEKRWFILVALAIVMFALRNGGLKVTDELSLPSAPILFVAYTLSMLWFFIPTKEVVTAKSKRIGIKLGLAAGLFSYGGLQLYAIALAIGQANLVAPIFATNSLIVAIGSILLFKERLNLVQGAAYLFMLAGLIVIRL
ncbi:DMT family transporter [Paenibacillus sp. GSMTC-2017]|uniref:DMT family transporter n=1 Tax=Paenibacillus sp. GSMTC-2017 TaxID=2794350 RepID=UPI0018D84581|nr:DMT family transporter [Paenibacillus sp. GSMTC-2017]MBH5319252.1 DMT family transporter [Paenibacillus sp. GSMTC-2017]